MGTGILSIGTSAMLANQAKLATVSHNISNASTEGYTRQDAALGTAGSRYTGGGYLGRGVSVLTVNRQTDALLIREVNRNTALAAADSTRLGKLKQLELAIPTGTAGIGFSAGQMINAFADVANNPQDLSARAVVLSNAETLASRVRTASAQLGDLQKGVVEDIRHNVSQINSIATDIAKLNQQIASATGSGHAPNDLLDQRDSMVKQLASLMQVSTVEADDGSLNVFTASGQQLVLGIHTQTLSASMDEFDPAKVRVSIGNYGVQSTLDTRSVGGGALAGLLRVQDEDIPAAQNQLGQLASAISWSVNRQQSFGLDLGTPASAGTALFDVGGMQVLASSRNATPNASNLISMTMTDGRDLQASDYSLAADPANPGDFVLTRLSDKASWSLSKGAPHTIDGFTIEIDNAVTDADKFMLRPVGTAGTQMSRVLDQATGIAAASPMTGTVAASNTGSASIGSLAVVAAPAGPYASVNVVFTSGADYELRDAANTVLATGTWDGSTPIAFNGVELRLNGAPKAGDSILIEPTTYNQQGNGNALALLNLRDQGLVGRLNSGSGSTAGASITDAYSQVIADVGLRVQDAHNSSEISGTLASTAENLLSNVAGVNLDEEASRLIQYQQAYQAAAKILQVAQSVFDTLLSINR